MCAVQDSQNSRSVLTSKAPIFFCKFISGFDQSARPSDSECLGDVAQTLAPWSARNSYKPRKLITHSSCCSEHSKMIYAVTPECRWNQFRSFRFNYPSFDTTVINPPIGRKSPLDFPNERGSGYSTRQLHFSEFAVSLPSHSGTKIETFFLSQKEK